MIVIPRVSTIDKPERYGGLLICGLNYGLAKGGIPQGETEFTPWGEYFTHPSHCTEDRFVRRLMTWFRWWNISLENENMPTELNQAISQTNLFYDSSKSFDTRSPDDVREAFKRLSRIISKMNISGLLLTSIQMSDTTKRQLHTDDWSICKSGRFTFKQSMAGSLRVAVCSHPRCPISRIDVENAKNTVGTWLNEVMNNYKRKQAEHLAGLLK